MAGAYANVDLMKLILNRFPSNKVADIFSPGGVIF